MLNFNHYRTPLESKMKRSDILSELRLQGIQANPTSSDEALLKLLTDNPKVKETNVKADALDQLELLKSAIIRAKSEQRLKTCVLRLKKLTTGTV